MITSKNPQTLIDYFKREFIVDRNVGLHTQDQYRMAIEKLNKWHGRPVRLDELTDSLLSRFIRATEDWTWRGERYSAKTRKGWRESIKTVWRHAHDGGFAPYQPTRRIRGVKVPAPMPEAWTLKQMSKLVAAAETLHFVGQSNGVPASLYMPTHLRYAYSTGFRKSDCFMSTLGELDFDNNIVQRRQNKTGNPIVGSFDAVTAKGLLALTAIRLMTENNGWRDATFKLDGGELHVTLPAPRDFAPLTMPAMCTKTFTNWFDACGKIAGIDTRRAKSQQIRRTAATLVQKETGRASDFLGHMSPNMVRHYVDRSKAAVAISPPSLEGISTAEVVKPDCCGRCGVELDDVSVALACEGCGVVLCSVDCEKAHQCQGGDE